MLLTNLAREVLALGHVDDALALATAAAAEAQRLDDQVVLQQNLLVRIRRYRDAGDLAQMGRLLDEFDRTQPARLPAGHIAFAAAAAERSAWAAGRGDLPAARAAADRAVAIAKASSQSHAILARALLGRADVAIREGRAGAAVADAERGLDIERRDAVAGVMLSQMGRAYAAVGRARQAAGDVGAARAALEQAVKHFAGALGDDHRDTVGARAVLDALPR